MEKWNKEYRKEYDKKRHASLKALRVDQNRQRRQKTREWLANIKATLKCSKCPENHPACLQFHHLRDKEFDIGESVRRGFSREKILEEMKKCIVICGNCHAKEHYKSRA